MTKTPDNIQIPHGNVDRAKNQYSVLFEIAWEVCNQVGGIYTVIRSKAPTMSQIFGDNYYLIGPYVHSNVSAIFDPIEDISNDPFGETVEAMRKMGYEVHFGHWLVTGRPKVILFNPFSAYDKLGDIKYELWENHGISTSEDDDLLNQVVAFGHITQVFFRELMKNAYANERGVISHFHEWMGATALPGIRRENQPWATVFTTHATLLGRYLAMNDPLFYEYLPFYDWEHEAKHFNIEGQVRIERAAAHGAHVLTTVSDLTAKECIHLLGREPEVILPNGLNIERFVALHEFQNLHLKYKEKIHEFCMGHFFQSYSFDLDKTLYFFTSGRYEYQNKGYDMAIEALARLNHKMKEADMDITVVMFFITKRPYQSILPGVLESKAVMEEIRHTCDEIQKQVGEGLFYASAANSEYKLPDLNAYVDDTMRLRLRRTIQSWKSDALPPIITHSLWNDGEDSILNFLRAAQLHNHSSDKVKVIYHPDFISHTNPLFKMDYDQFVRGCHLGVFPSYYEPWGYTPLECMARGVPAVTSDLSGFGDYIQNIMPDHESRGTYVVERNGKLFNDSAENLANLMFKFVQLNRRDRIQQRNKVEEASVYFDWQYLGIKYEEAYTMALLRIGR